MLVEWMNEGLNENLFCLEGRGDGGMDGILFLFLLPDWSLHKEDENSCFELIGNWKYFRMNCFSIGCFVKLKLDICKKQVEIHISLIYLMWVTSTPAVHSKALV